MKIFYAKTHIIVYVKYPFRKKKRHVLLLICWGKFVLKSFTFFFKKLCFFFLYKNYVSKPDLGIDD